MLRDADLPAGFTGKIFWFFFGSSPNIMMILGSVKPVNLGFANEYFMANSVWSK